MKCKFCGAELTPGMWKTTYAKMCDRCYGLHQHISENFELAKIILRAVKSEREGKNEPKRKHQ